MSKIGNDSLSKKNSEYIDNVIDKQLDQKMNKISESTKEDLVEAFMITQFVSSDNAAQQIKNIREKQIRSGKKGINRMTLKSRINSLGLYGGINKGAYKDIYDQYNTLINKSLDESSKNKELEVLDNILATRVILDSSVSSVTHSFKKRAFFENKVVRDMVFEKIKKYPQYKDGDNDFLETKEINLSSGRYYSIQRKDEIGDVENIDDSQEDNEIHEENYEDFNQEKNESKEKIDLGGEVDVNFSDMRQTIKDIADERIYSEDSQDYIESLNNKNTVFGRMMLSAKQAMFGDLFRLRKYRRENRNINKEKNKLNVTGNRSNIAYIHGQQSLSPVLDLTRENYPLVYAAIDKLSYDFYRGGSTMQDTEFEKKLRNIFDNAGPLLAELEENGVSIEKSASDILNTLKIQKAQNQLSYDVSKAVADVLGGNETLNEAKENALSTKISNLFKEFTKTYQVFPKLLSDYNKVQQNISGLQKLNLNESYEDISKKLVSHTDALTTIASQSMSSRIKLNIKFLANGHSADHIESKKQEKLKRRNPLAKLGEKMYGNGYKWRRFPTKLLATGGTAAIGAAMFGPLGAILGGSLVAGSLAAGKKAGQLNKKKHSIEKEYVKDRNNKLNYMREEDIQKMKYLQGIGNYEEIKEEFDNILSKPGLKSEEKAKLIGLLSRVLAGLDHQKNTGHNAFSIETKAEGSTPEQINISKETNYNKAMSELYRYKDVALKRLQLEDEHITESDIRDKDDYNYFTAGYKGNFKKFLEGFKKERNKEMWKTGVRTAGTYAAMGLATAGVAEFVDWMGGGSDSGVDLGDLSPIDGLDETVNTGYELGNFDASPDFSANLSDQLANLPNDATNLQVDYFAGIDATPAFSDAFTADMINDKISNIESLLNSGNFSQATIDSARDVISQDNVQDLIDFAQTNGADAGNQNLFALRNLEGVEELLKQTNGNNDVNLDFNFDNSHSIIGDNPYNPSDRMSGIHLEAKPEDIPLDDVVSNNDSGSWRAGQGIYNEDNTHKGDDGF